MCFLYARFLCGGYLAGDAQGEAEAANLIANAVANNPGFIELREIQYAKDVADTIAKSNFKVYRFEWIRERAQESRERVCVS
jgi:hypothetical protein